MAIAFHGGREVINTSKQANRQATLQRGVEVFSMAAATLELYQGRLKRAHLEATSGRMRWDAGERASRTRAAWMPPPHGHVDRGCV